MTGLGTVLSDVLSLVMLRILRYVSVMRLGSFSLEHSAALDRGWETPGQICFKASIRALALDGRTSALSYLIPILRGHPPSSHTPCTSGGN